ncbi:hypothetical protein ACI3ER_12060 [Bacillus sp. Wb]
MDILEFTREFHPNIWEEYYRYNRKSILPAIGTKVITLVNGYDGYAGGTRYIVGHGDKYIHLAHTSDGKVTSLCDVEMWWKDLKIIDEPRN